MSYWMKIAEQELARNVKEIPRAGNNLRILEYHRTCKLRPGKWGQGQDETDWCSSFVNWVMLQWGCIGSQLPNARSWLNWGVACQQQYGAITVLRNPNHVGFLYNIGPGNKIALLGGNQSLQELSEYQSLPKHNCVCIKSYPLVRVAAYRWPAMSILPVQSCG